MGKNKKSQSSNAQQAKSTTLQQPAPLQTTNQKQEQKHQKLISPAVPVSSQSPNPRKFQVSTAKPFQVLNYTFCSKKVFFQFMSFSLLIVLVPIIIVHSTYNHVKDDPSYSQLAKIALSVGPSLVLINILIGFYIYKVIKDPQNYTKDQPLKHVIPVGFKEQNMDRRRYVNQSKREITQSILAQQPQSKTQTKPAQILKTTKQTDKDEKVKQNQSNVKKIATNQAENKQNSGIEKNGTKKKKTNKKKNQ